MCQCATATGTGVGFRFWQQDIDLGVRFDGGQLTSDGGLPWVVQAEQALGVCAALAACVPEWRRGGVRHSLTVKRQEEVPVWRHRKSPDDGVIGRSDQPMYSVG